MERCPSASAPPLLSVIVLNYNGKAWLSRCIESISAQSVEGGLELIVADNASIDGSDVQGAEMLSGLSGARFIQHGKNLGFCEGNNVAASEARGRFLLFLNNDTWLEKECLRILMEETLRANAQAATPLILNYDSDEYQGIFGEGFDFCGYPSFGPAGQETRPILMPPGCSYLIRRDVFFELGGFDTQIFMYGDEFDLSWRLWAAGHRAVAVPRARLHHRGAASANPAGGEKFVEARTTEFKRYLANRNSLLVLLKNSQHVLLLLILPQIVVAMMESLGGALISARWSFFRNAFVYAIRDCWRFRTHIIRERQKIQALRQRGDLWFIRFFRLRPNRWDEYCRIAKLGIPRIS